MTSIRSLLPPPELPPDPIEPKPDKLVAPPLLLLLLPFPPVVMDPPEVAPCWPYSFDSILARLFPRPLEPEAFDPTMELVYLMISVSGGNRTPRSEDGSL